MKSFFTPKEVSELIGISYRQIQYWDKSNFIKPSYRRHGKYRLYTFQDLIQLRFARLLRGDRSIQSLRRTVKALRGLLPKVAYPLAEITLLVEGERILVFRGDVMMSPDSETAFTALRIQELREEIREMFPSDEPLASLG